MPGVHSLMNPRFSDRKVRVMTRRTTYSGGWWGQRIFNRADRDRPGRHEPEEGRLDVRRRINGLGSGTDSERPIVIKGPAELVQLGEP